MSHFTEVRDNAHAAYREVRNGDAALLFRQAAALALEIGDRVGWFEMTFLAANAARLAGSPREAQALLLDARTREPPEAPPRVAWWVRVEGFSIAYATRPDRARLEQMLIDLRAYADVHPVPAGDLPMHEAIWLDLIGAWDQALAHSETAWQVHQKRGYRKSFIADFAAEICLRLDRPANCRDWIDAMGRAGDDGLATVALGQTQRRLDLALAEGAPLAECRRLLRRLTDQTQTTQSARSAADLRDLSVRVALLDPAHGDPADRLHPARGELRRSPPNRWHVHDRYRARLLFLDYRLACLRHALGVPPVDDKYHRHPVAAPGHTASAAGAVGTGSPGPAGDANPRTAAGSAETPSAADLAHRLHKARAAARWAMAYAEYLDGLLQCDWRTLEVTDRRARIESIATVGEAR